MFRSILLFSLFFQLHTINSLSQVYTSQENYDITFYHIDIKVSDTSTYISATATITAKILYTQDSLIFNLGNQLVVSKVKINGLLASFSQNDEKLIIYSDCIKAGETVSVVIYYAGDGNDEQYFGAIFNSNFPPYGNFTYSLTEPYSTKCWYPCKEVLSDKADSVFVSITVANGLKAGSNGLLKDIVQIDKDHVQYNWETKYPTAYYLISFAVGNYLDYTSYTTLQNTNAQLPIINYLYNSESYFEKQKPNIDTTAYLIKLFSKLFLPYPFQNEKYGHCIAPMVGGMENQTMTTLSNFGFELVAHELAHQWFGNMTTCASWSDIWLNEGFASYSEYLAYEYSGYITEAQDWMENAQYAASNSMDLSIYVPESELKEHSRIFNYSTTYKKGAVIIHMLRYELQNDSLFFLVLKEYLLQHAYGVASATDFISVLQRVSNRSFNNFFDQWYYGAGYPVFDVEWYQKSDTLYIMNHQTTSVPEKTPFFELKMQYQLISPEGDTLVESRITSETDLVKIRTDKQISEIKLDPGNFILKKVNTIRRIESMDTSIQTTIRY
jgi:aminopeptidase N